MSSFDYIWALLNPSDDYLPVKRRCQMLWDTYPLEQQRDIYRRIRDKQKERKFIDFNPLFAIQKNANPPRPKPQVLSYNDYYLRYGTTEERDGWKMANPTGQKVIYVKPA
jgi:hypothetical protein